MRGILAGLFERRATVGQGFHVSQTPPGWIDSLSGWNTATGARVHPDMALEVNAVFACTRILAEGVAMLPLPVYRRLSPRGKERAPEHYLYPILHDLPNPEMTSFTFRETLMGHVCTWGNGYAEIAHNQAGGIDALWPLRPDKMRVRRVAGRLEYVYRLPEKFGAAEVLLSAEQVLHVKGLSFDGTVAYSPIQLQRQAVGLSLATEEFGGRFFGNGARPGVVLRHPGKLSDEAHKRLTKSYENRHQGLENAHRVAILEEGLDLQEVGIPPEDAQYLETRKFQLNEIARMYRVPPHMLADLERATFSNIEHLSLEFVIYTLSPWLARWEQEIHRSLLTPAERRVYFVEHLVDGLLRGDIKSRYEAHATGRQNGWLSANDIREIENMNPIDGGDVYLVPLNMVPADQVGLGMTGTESEPGDDEYSSTRGSPPSVPPIGGEVETRAAGYRRRLMQAHFRVYQDVAARVLRREMNDVGNAARRFLQRRDYGEFMVWLGDFYREHPSFVERQFNPLALSYGELVAAAAQDEVGSEAGLTPELERWIRAYVATFGARHSIVSENRVRAAAEAALAQNEDPLAGIEGELGTWEETRSAETARWESVRFGNGLALAVYAFAGIVRKRWASFGENCPYCSSLDGRTIGINHFFIDAGTEWQPEGAERPLSVSHNVGHPPAHDGCDCMVVSSQ